MIRGGQPKASAKPPAAAVKPTPTASVRPAAPAQMTPGKAAAVDDAQAKEQPPKKEAEEAETSASGDDENLSRSTNELSRTGLQEEVPRDTFQAWKDARPKAQSIPENVQAEASPAAPE